MTTSSSFAARHADTKRAMAVMAPGWVRTELGGSLTIEESIPKLVNVLLVNVLPAKRGRKGLEYLDYLGCTAPW